MLQAIGLTSTPRRNRPPAVHDLTFQARPGRVTALFGAPGSGKTTALRLLLGLEPGRGVTYFRGRPLHRAAHPSREVGAFLGGVPGHPARSVRGQLRMVCAAAGVPAARADELLDAVGLAELRDQRLGTLSLGMERRLGIAAALLADPHALVLDEPAAGLSPRDSRWLPGLLRAHADGGGTVLFTTDDPRQAARTADHVVALAGGRLVADQEAAVFARSRLRPCVTVHTPHAARLAAHLTREARAARRSLEAVTDTGNRLHVYGGTCAEVGEAAFRHGILIHRLAPGTTPTSADPAPPPTRRSPPAPSADPGPVGPRPGADAAGGPGAGVPSVAHTGAPVAASALPYPAGPGVADLGPAVSRPDASTSTVRGAVRGALLAAQGGGPTPPLPFPVAPGRVPPNRGRAPSDAVEVGGPAGDVPHTTPSCGSGAGPHGPGAVRRGERGCGAAPSGPHGPGVAREGSTAGSAGRGGEPAGG
ncbi:ATP-binding cassette domain-containing protein, partial [Streptomyces sp. MUM 203J]|uniref:ATP-binding cassette domain-containing protein n=1 Tax=Streptomyces sp. MUM 203J TaxID=2791990 RepID=UPI001F04DAB9